MDTIPAIGILVFQGNKVLLVKHGVKASHLTGMYGVPGGRFQKDETEKQVAVRELEEETGLVTEEKDLVSYPDNVYVADILRKDGTIKQFSIKIFVCKKFSGSLKSSEETTPEWIAMKDLKKYNLLPNIEKMVEEGEKVL